MQLNPEKIPNEELPSGWRFLTTADLPINHTPCRCWLPISKRFSDQTNYLGDESHRFTYIVPIDPPQPPIFVNSNEEMHRAIQEIYFLIQGSADDAPDATPHDKLCAQIYALIHHLV